MTEKMKFRQIRRNLSRNLRYSSARERPNRGKKIVKFLARTKVPEPGLAHLNLSAREEVPVLLLDICFEGQAPSDELVLLKEGAGAIPSVGKVVIIWLGE